MAAFSSNIDITSGGTYAMDVTNGETSSKVATDLNGKFANIQELLQNGLPEVWTGDSLPDSLPNGKIIYYNNNLYYQNGDTVTQYYYNNIGDLHVWRKTVKNEADIPAGYTLGAAKEVELIKGKNNSGSALDYRTIIVSYSTSITVNDIRYNVQDYAVNKVELDKNSEQIESDPFYKLLGAFTALISLIMIGFFATLYFQ